MTYQDSQVRRHRATPEEMEARAEFLISYALEHGPVTVRGLFYAATVAGLPSITKDEAGYNKVQSQVLDLRRSGRLPYETISDQTRYMRKPSTHAGWIHALKIAAKNYRKDLWSSSAERVEIWLEKAALAGVVFPVTAKYDVPLMPTGGYCSETFAHDAVLEMRYTGKTLVIYTLYDFDRSGKDAEASLQEKVERFGRKYGVPVTFSSIGLSLGQVQAHALPTRPPKRNTSADQRWPYDFAVELDAMPPDDLRNLVGDIIEAHLPKDKFAILKKVEEIEREAFLEFAEGAVR